MAPESFNASLPERDIILAKCVFCSKVRRAKMLTSKELIISTFFSLFFVYEFRVFCPYFQTLNSCVSSFFVRSTLCAPHIFFRSVSLSRVALKPLITSIREKKKKNSFLIDRSWVCFFCVLWLVKSALKTEHSRSPLSKFIKPREEADSSVI